MGVALRDIIADYKTPVTWEALPGIAAIDANNALYQFLTIIRQPDGTPLMDRRGRVTSHLSGILFRVASFMEKGIKPVFVFDGKPSPSSRRPLTSAGRFAQRQGRSGRKRWSGVTRRRCTSRPGPRPGLIQPSSKPQKSSLGLMGIPIVQAPGEGEAQASYMVAKGDARYVVSQDYDTLLFGAPLLVRNLTVSGQAYSPAGRSR